MNCHTEENNTIEKSEIQTKEQEKAKHKQKNNKKTKYKQKHKKKLHEMNIHLSRWQSSQTRHLNFLDHHVSVRTW